MSKRNNTLQALCRGYLNKLRYIGKKRGVDVGALIKLTHQKDCKPTEHEVMMLARMCNGERIQRNDVPKVLGKSYRQCVEDEDFENIKQLPRTGTYSKVSAILHKNEKQKKWK